jgi:hypothetical protein
MFNVIKTLMAKSQNTAMRNRTRQKQKISPRLVFVAASAFIVVMIVCWTIFFNVVHIDQSIAGGANTTVIGDQELVNEMAIPAPVITHAAVSQYSIQTRAAKPIQNAQ